MPLIVDRQICPADTWQLLDEDQWPVEAGWPQNQQPFIVPSARLAAAPLPTDRPLGAWLTSEQSAEDLLPWLAHMQLVVVEFLTFRDGRGLSLARLLRRAGFTGQLRAAGEVARDRLAYMEQCGFNAFDIPDERFQTADLAAFTEFSVSYQPQANGERQSVSY